MTASRHRFHHTTTTYTPPDGAASVYNGSEFIRTLATVFSLDTGVAEKMDALDVPVAERDRYRALLAGDGAAS